MPAQNGELAELVTGARTSRRLPMLKEADERVAWPRTEQETSKCSAVAPGAILARPGFTSPDREGALVPSTARGGAEIVRGHAGDRPLQASALTELIHDSRECPNADASV